jgi:hypothetical protein
MEPVQHAQSRTFTRLHRWYRGELVSSPTGDTDQADIATTNTPTTGVQIRALACDDGAYYIVCARTSERLKLAVGADDAPSGVVHAAEAMAR